MHRMLSVGNLSSNIATQPYNAFLIILNLEKDLSPEALVTPKLRNKGPRARIN